MRNTLLWIFTVIFTLSIAIYQRMTGPTYPVRGEVEIEEATVSYRLIRSHTTGQNAPVIIEAPEHILGVMHFRRFRSHDDWTTIPLIRNSGQLTGEIPTQPSAGKVQYNVLLGVTPDNLQPLTVEPVVIRFKGAVPSLVLIPHILLMFLAMLYSSRAGLEAAFNGPKTLSIVQFTAVFLFIGGIILGPIVQKYAFGAFWTGWPWGHDLTDNKTLVAMIMWGIAWWRIRRNPAARGWAIAAAIVLLAVYLVPHSVLGSELDYTQMEAGIPGE